MSFDLDRHLINASYPEVRAPVLAPGLRPPEITAANIGRTPATAYDATHGFSDQYILEADVFIKAAERAGLKPDERFSHRFPNSAMCTVTINLMKG